MIPLKINGNQTNVPTISELSTGKFLKLLDMNEFNFIDYLSVVLDMSKKVASNLKIKNLPFLYDQLYGTIPDYELSRPQKRLVIDKKNYNLNDDFTIGQRITIEEVGRGKTENELIILILAVACDSENYEKLIPKILESPAKNVMPEAFFLLRNLSSGRSYARNFIRMLRIITTLIKNLKSKLA